VGEFDDLTKGDPRPDTPRQEWSVRARRELTEELVLEEVGGIGGRHAGLVLEVHETMRSRARLHARSLRQLVTLFDLDPDNEDDLDDADMTAMKVSVGLRCTILQATSRIHDAHRAVVDMPRMFAHLEAGDLPEEFHRFLLRQIRRLSGVQVRRVDELLARVEIPSVPRSTFEAQVRLAVTSVVDLQESPRAARNVAIVGIDSDLGTATLHVTGPLTEIRGFAQRLDACARTVQRAQRAALEAGEATPIPFDIDEDLRERGRPHGLGTLRYAILTHSLLDLDPVQETASPFKILVTIPATTLLGMDDAPAMLDGLSPIPAELARELAAKSPTWQRILTDPITGAHLPVCADTYQPTAQMRLQLRLRHPLCAAPGCGRPTGLAAEDDHILEYDHRHPDEGGRTSLWNLHRLCRRHHQLKTAGLLDPLRDPRDDPGGGDGLTSAAPLTTTWEIGDELRIRTRERPDLLTPRMIRLLAQAERRCRGAGEDVEERLAESALEKWLRTPEARRIIPPGPTIDETAPPF